MDFLFVLIELFRNVPLLEALYERILIGNRLFERMGQFRPNFHGEKGTSPTNHFFHGKIDQHAGLIWAAPSGVQYAASISTAQAAAAAR